MFHSLGLGPGCYVYVAEALDTRIRSKGISVGLLITRLFSGVAMTGFPVLEEMIGIDGIFTILAAVNMGAFTFLFLFVPETRNISLEALRGVFERDLFIDPRIGPERAPWAWPARSQ